VARRLEKRGVPARRLVIGAQLLGQDDVRRREAAELAAWRDAELALRLGAGAGHGVEGATPDLDPRHVPRAAAAYRHDCLAAHQFLADALEDPPSVRLTPPVSVVVAADDPSTSGFAEHHRDWELLAETVDLHVLDQGGHHFLRTCPAEAALAALCAADLVPTS